MNEFQKVYEQTRHITPNALRWLTVVRAALAGGTVNEGEVQKALAAGGGGIGELLETIGELEETDTQELVESLEGGFDPFGRLI